MRTQWFGQKYVVITPTGILDGGVETKALEAELIEHIHRASTCVIVNLAEVPHFNSHGLSVLTNALSTAQRVNKKFVAIGVDLRIHNTILVRKLEALFGTLYCSVQAVIDDCEQNPAH